MAKRKVSEWGWDYLHEGKPLSITRNGRSLLVLDQEGPSQLRQVREVIRMLRKAEQGREQRGAK